MVIVNAYSMNGNTVMLTLRFAPLVLLITVLPGQAAADAVGWRIGANAWQQQYDGDVQNGPSKLSLEDDLGFDEETGYNLYLQVEHPVPVLPNLMVQRTQMDADATGDIDSFIFDGNVYSGEVRSNLDLTHMVCYLVDYARGYGGF